jgi:PleD family two-component response regulator
MRRRDETIARPARILIVAADDDERAAIRQALDREFKIVDAADFTRAYARLLKAQVDLVVIKSAGPPPDGIEFIKRVRATPRLTDILILVVAEWGTGEPTLALSAGANAYEATDGSNAVDLDRLHTSIERLLSPQAAAAN